MLFYLDFNDGQKETDKQEAQGPWRSAWTEDPVHKNVLKSFK